MSARTLALKELASTRESLAREIAQLWDKWDQQRSGWKAETLEVRNYLFATDTSTTSNSTLPWKNKTTIPKLCQIRDNLYANYMSGLFPNPEWLRWEGHTKADADRQKAQVVQSYMSNKFREGHSYKIVGELVDDYIGAGNAFIDTEFVKEYKVEEDGKRIPKYIGPRFVRIAPNDIVFNPYATSFRETPKIVRSILQLGDIERRAEVDPDSAFWADILPKLRQSRAITMNPALRVEDFEKSMAFQVDGFGNLGEYFNSGLVEVLELEGDIYDQATNTLYTDYVITVVDRMHVARSEKLPSWCGSTKHQVVWRRRPDNLWGMGPLANLVGMQYRIDHLENLKADVFDSIAYPRELIKGDVPPYPNGPGAKIYLPDPESDVSFLHPDTTALNADTQIAMLEARMEQFAGSPRETMGIRSPGEKTKFEVQSLVTAAGRIFQEKLENFEINGLEPALNDALEKSVRNMDAGDIVRIFDNEVGAIRFTSITKEDITAKGKLRPVGARHYALQAQLTQDLVSLSQTPIWQDIRAHMSSKRLAKLVEDLLGIDRFDLIADNVRVFEEIETQKLAAAASDQAAAEQMTPQDGSIPNA